MLDSARSCYDVIVVGGGVVGCAVLRELTVHRGLCCMLVEASPHLVSGASSGNTGIACTEHDVAPGTLEYACLQDASRLNVPTYQALNVPHRPSGSLYIGHSEEDMAVLARELEVRKSRGDSSASLVTADAARALEPALDAGVVGGLVLPRETVVDPWLVPIAYARHAHENGASIQRGTKVTAATWDVDCWRLTFAPTLAHQTVPAAAETVAAYEVKARVVVACGGLRGDELEALHRPPPFAIRPRRGDFILFEAGAVMGDMPLGGVPSAKGRGVYVWRSVHGVVAVGPTAEEVAERATPPSATTDSVREALRAAAIRAIPSLRESAVVGTYAGLRPGTDVSSDYQIESGGVARPWISVGGIRSTGLTASLGIARHVSRLYDELRTRSPTGDAQGRPAQVRTTPLPPVAEMVASFRERGDGTVVFGRDEIGFGAHYVTHPLTRAGFERLAAGRAADKETVADLYTLDGRVYLERFDVQAKLSTAVAAVLKERPANPLLAIAELLSKSK